MCIKAREGFLETVMDSESRVWKEIALGVMEFTDKGLGIGSSSGVVIVSFAQG